MGRLVGTPELGPTPGFRPESAGGEEYRVDLVIERRVLPPITREEARGHPVLADLEVLSRPWGGTNLSMTREQWWAIRELIPLEPGKPTEVRWGPLVRWAARFAESVDFDAVERNYKLEIHDHLVAARDAVVAGDPEWPRLLRRSFGSPNNLTHWQVHGRYLDWVDAHRDDAREALLAFWSDEHGITDAVEAFASALPDDITGAGNRTNLVTFLAAGRGAEDYPVYRATVFNTAYRLTGWPHQWVNRRGCPCRRPDCRTATEGRHCAGAIPRFLRPRPALLEARTGGARPRRQPRRSRHTAVCPYRSAGDPPRIAVRLPPSRRHPRQRPRARSTTDQFRTRTGLPLPIEVVYDDFTPDILENRLLRTAVDTLGGLYLGHRDSHTSLTRLRQQLNGITSLVPDRRGAPEPHWTRLNERYRPAVALARLIITTAGLEARVGGQDASVFLVDMNTVFERFVRVALREALQLHDQTFPPAARGHSLHLDAEQGIPLKPDLPWWSRGSCVFAGDCKYKRPEGTIPNADVYQMLAYLTALQLTNGLLVYAAGEDTPHTTTVPFAGKRILVRTVDVSQEPHDVLAQIAKLASLIRSIAVGPGIAAAIGS